MVLRRLLMVFTIVFLVVGSVAAQPIENSEIRLGRGQAVNLHWSPDGKWFAVSSSLGVWLYNAGNPQGEPRLFSTGTVPDQVFFTEDELYLLVRSCSTCSDRFVLMFDLDSGELVRQQSFSDVNLVLVFSPDGSRYASYTDSNGLQVWNALADDDPITLQPADENLVWNQLAFMPDGRLWVSAIGPPDVSVVEIHDVTARSLVKEVPNSLRYLQAPLFSPDGNWTAVTGLNADFETVLSIYDSRQRVVLQETLGYEDRSTRLSADGRSIIYVDRNNRVRVLELATRRIETALVLPRQISRLHGLFALPGGGVAAVVSPSSAEVMWYEWHPGERMTQQPVNGYAPALSPDGRTLALLDDSALIYWYGLPDMKGLGHFTGFGYPVEKVAYSPDGQLVAGVMVDDRGAVSFHLLRVWDANSQDVVATFNIKNAFAPSRPLFTPDSRYLLYSDAQGVATLWDLQDEKIAYQVDNEGSPVTTLGLFPGGERFLLGDEAGTLAVVATDSGTIEQRWTVGESIISFTMSPDGSLAALLLWDSQSGYQQVQLWDIESGEALDTLLVDAYFEPDNLLFSPDQRYLTATYVDASVVMTFDVERTALAQMVYVYNDEGSPPSMTTLALSPDSQTLLIGTSDASIVAWNLPYNYQEWSIGTVGSSSIDHIEFSPDAASFAVVSQFISRYEWGTRESIANRNAYYSAGIADVVFKPDGSQVAFAARNGVVYLWSGDTREGFG